MTSTQNSSIEITSVLVDDRIELTIEEICQSCKVDENVIVELIEQGVIEPKARLTQPWRFSALALPRIARALRLQRDFDLNSAGVALALDLLAEIESLKSRLNRLDTGGETRL